MTVREFTSRVWYIQQIIVIKWQEFDKVKDKANIEEIKEKAFMYGANHELSSVTYEKVNNMLVDSYGVIDDYLIIEVH